MQVELYGPIKEEAGVVMVFTKLHGQLGFPKLVPSSARGFDIDDIEYKKGKRVTVEFEYLSENFISDTPTIQLINDYITKNNVNYGNYLDYLVKNKIMQKFRQSFRSMH